MKQMLMVLLLITVLFISGCSSQNQNQQLVGNDRDSHGCIGSAGYSWCEAKQKCLRVWEENCTEAGQVQQASAIPSGNLGIKKDIEISGFAFNPSTITIPKGASVIWTNRDSAPHTIVSDNGDEINSDRISQGDTYAHSFNAAGTYDYHCGLHPSMKGQIIVE